MPRQPRISLPGIALHVVQRGNNRAACFADDRDRAVYLSVLRKMLDLHECSLHAYCLMTNHVHLLLTPEGESACSKLMRNLGQVYVQYFNKRHHRSGTLWEGRYRSCLVGSAEYVLGCYRYIELNPVRAGITSKAGSYQWSSHQANAGLTRDPMIHPHREYQSLGMDEESKYLAYRGLFAVGMPVAAVDAIRRSTKGGYPLVGDDIKLRLNPKVRYEARRPGPRSGDQNKSSGSDPDLFSGGAAS